MDHLSSSRHSSQTSTHSLTYPHALHTGLTKEAWAEDVVDQYRALGLPPDTARRFFQLLAAELAEVLGSIDPHALAAAPTPEQVSMLLPRFDISRLAASSGIATAKVQSAAAMLVMEFVLHEQRLFQS